MSRANGPSRVILNFTHRCAMNCEWCYVPFGTMPAVRENVFLIVKRIVDLGFTSITIGGGDPFQYRFTPDLIRFAKSLNLFVHIDTHGKNLLESVDNMSLISSNIDLLGLPIDGSTSEIHDLMRGSSGHFNLVRRRLSWLFPERSRIKLNTVISAINVFNFQELSHFVASYSPLRWSIYQYWPVGPAARVDTKHSISDVDFIDCTSTLAEAFSNVSTIIEVNSSESRRDTYPIIHHDGQVFIHSPAPENTFVPLGSIFESDIMEKILLGCSAERRAAASRYAQFSIKQL